MAGGQILNWTPGTPKMQVYLRGYSTYVNGGWWQEWQRKDGLWEYTWTPKAPPIIEFRDV